MRDKSERNITQSYKEDTDHLEAGNSNSTKGGNASMKLDDHSKNERIGYTDKPIESFQDKAGFDDNFEFVIPIAIASYMSQDPNSKKSNSVVCDPSVRIDQPLDISQDWWDQMKGTSRVSSHSSSRMDQSGLSNLKADKYPVHMQGQVERREKEEKHGNPFDSFEFPAVAERSIDISQNNISNCMLEKSIELAKKTAEILERGSQHRLQVAAKQKVEEEILQPGLKIINHQTMPLLSEKITDLLQRSNASIKQTQKIQNKSNCDSDQLKNDLKEDMFNSFVETNSNVSSNYSLKINEEVIESSKQTNLLHTITLNSLQEKKENGFEQKGEQAKELKENDNNDKSFHFSDFNSKNDNNSIHFSDFNSNQHLSSITGKSKSFKSELGDDQCYQANGRISEKLGLSMFPSYKDDERDDIEKSFGLSAFRDPTSLSESEASQWSQKFKQQNLQLRNTQIFGFNHSDFMNDNGVKSLNISSASSSLKGQLRQHTIGISDFFSEAELKDSDNVDDWSIEVPKSKAQRKLEAEALDQLVRIIDLSESAEAKIAKQLMLKSQQEFELKKDGQNDIIHKQSAKQNRLNSKGRLASFAEGSKGGDTAVEDKQKKSTSSQYQSTSNAQVDGETLFEEREYAIYDVMQASRIQEEGETKLNSVKPQEKTIMSFFGESETEVAKDFATLPILYSVQQGIGEQGINQIIKEVKKISDRNPDNQEADKYEKNNLTERLEIKSQVSFTLLEQNYPQAEKERLSTGDKIEEDQTKTVQNPQNFAKEKKFIGPTSFEPNYNFNWGDFTDARNVAKSCSSAGEFSLNLQNDSICQGYQNFEKDQQDEEEEVDWMDFSLPRKGTFNNHIEGEISNTIPPTPPSLVPRRSKIDTSLNLTEVKKDEMKKQIVVSKSPAEGMIDMEAPTIFRPKENIQPVNTNFLDGLDEILGGLAAMPRLQPSKKKVFTEDNLSLEALKTEAEKELQKERNQNNLMTLDVGIALSEEYDASFNSDIKEEQEEAEHSNEDIQDQPYSLRAVEVGDIKFVLGQLPGRSTASVEIDNNQILSSYHLEQQQNNIFPNLQIQNSSKKEDNQKYRLNFEEKNFQSCEFDLETDNQKVQDNYKEEPQKLPKKIKTDWFFDDQKSINEIRSNIDADKGQPFIPVIEQPELDLKTVNLNYDSEAKKNFFNEEKYEICQNMDIKKSRDIEIKFEPKQLFLEKEINLSQFTDKPKSKKGRSTQLGELSGGIIGQKQGLTLLNQMIRGPEVDVQIQNKEFNFQMITEKDSRQLVQFNDTLDKKKELLNEDDPSNQLFAELQILEVPSSFVSLSSNVRPAFQSDQYLPFQKEKEKEKEKKDVPSSFSLIGIPRFLEVAHIDGVADMKSSKSSLSNINCSEIKYSPENDRKDQDVFVWDELRSVEQVNDSLTNSNFTIAIQQQLSEMEEAEEREIQTAVTKNFSRYLNVPNQMGMSVSNPMNFTPDSAVFLENIENPMKSATRIETHSRGNTQNLLFVESLFDIIKQEEPSHVQISQDKDRQTTNQAFSLFDCNIMRSEVKSSVMRDSQLGEEIGNNQEKRNNKKKRNNSNGLSQPVNSQTTLLTVDTVKSEYEMSEITRMKFVVGDNQKAQGDIGIDRVHDSQRPGIFTESICFYDEKQKQEIQQTNQNRKDQQNLRIDQKLSVSTYSSQEEDTQQQQKDSSEEEAQQLQGKAGIRLALSSLLSNNNQSAKLTKSLIISEVEEPEEISPVNHSLNLEYHQDADGWMVEKEEGRKTINDLSNKLNYILIILIDCFCSQKEKQPERVGRKSGIVATLQVPSSASASNKQYSSHLTDLPFSISPQRSPVRKVVQLPDEEVRKQRENHEKSQSEIEKIKQEISRMMHQQIKEAELQDFQDLMSKKQNMNLTFQIAGLNHKLHLLTQTHLTLISRINQIQPSLHSNSNSSSAQINQLVSSPSNQTDLPIHSSIPTRINSVPFAQTKVEPSNRESSFKGGKTSLQSKMTSQLTKDKSASYKSSIGLANSVTISDYKESDEFSATPRSSMPSKDPLLPHSPKQFFQQSINSSNEVQSLFTTSLPTTYFTDIMSKLENTQQSIIQLRNEVLQHPQQPLSMKPTQDSCFNISQKDRFASKISNIMDEIQEVSKEDINKSTLKSSSSPLTPRISFSEKIQTIQKQVQANNEKLNQINKDFLDVQEEVTPILKKGSFQNRNTQLFRYLNPIKNPKSLLQVNGYRSNYRQNNLNQDNHSFTAINKNNLHNKEQRRCETTERKRGVNYFSMKNQQQLNSEYFNKKTFVEANISDLQIQGEPPNQQQRTQKDFWDPFVLSQISPKSSQKQCLAIPPHQIKHNNIQYEENQPANKPQRLIAQSKEFPAINAFMKFAKILEEKPIISDFQNSPSLTNNANVSEIISQNHPFTPMSKAKAVAVHIFRDSPLDFSINQYKKNFVSNFGSSNQI